MGLSAILAAAAAALKPLTVGDAGPPAVPAVAREVHADPPERIVRHPTVYVEARGGVSRLPGGGFEGELGAWDHEFVVVGTVGQGYEPRFHRAAVDLFDAMRALLDADHTLGGAVTAANATAYRVQLVTVGGIEHTAAVVTVRAEEK